MRPLSVSELLDAPTTLASLPHNIPAGQAVTVTVCATPIRIEDSPFGRPCWIVLDEHGACAVHGQPGEPHRVTVGSAWDGEGNRTMTHSMWRCRH